MASAHSSLPLPEPKTPMWLPALGAALFVVAAIVWAVMPSSTPPAQADAAPSASAPPPAPASAAVRANPPPGNPGNNNAAVQQLLDQLHKGQKP